MVIKVKKILTLFVLLFLFGCELGNTPTSKVEDLLSKYQMLDEDISEEIEEVINKEGLTEEQRERYRKILEKQYKNMSYEVKDETEDGNTATIKVEIEVIDYKKIINELESEYQDRDYTLEEYNNEKLNRLESAKDMVTYTIEFTVTKDDNDNWNVDSLTNVDRKKIQGMY